MSNSELDQVLAEEDEDIEGNLELDDILNESDTSQPDNVLDEDIRKVLIQQKNKPILTNNFKYDEQLAHQLIKAHMDQDISAIHREEQQLIQKRESEVYQFQPNKESIKVIQSRLDIIDQQERDISNNQDSGQQRPSQTLFSLNKQVNNFTFKLEEIRAQKQQIENLQIHNLTTLSKNLQNKSSNNRFKPPILGQVCIIYENPGISICLGTTAGEVVIFSETNFDAYIVLKYKSRVTAIDVVSEGYILVAGYEDGHIVLWDPNSGALLKSLDNKYNLTSVKFYNSANMNFVGTDAQGFTNVYKVSKVLWSYQVDLDKLLPRNISPFYQIATPLQDNIISIACLEYVLVVKIEPEKSILKRITMRETDELIYPCMSWGQMTNNSDFTEIIQTTLAISYGQVLQFYTQNKDQVYDLISTCTFKECLLGILWASRDMLIGVDKDFNILSINSQCYQNQNIKAIQSKVQLEDNLLHPLILKNQKGQEVKVFTNSITGSKQTTLLYCLTQPNIKRCKLLLWSEYLKLLIQKADNQQGWYQILVLGLQLYWGQLYCFAIHPNEQFDQRIVIGEISKDICGTFLNLVGQQIEQGKYPESQKSKEWDQAIVAAIQYCIECNQTQFLFNGLKQILINFNRYTIFLNSLEPFILLQKIKQIPLDTLQQIATHYKVLEKRTVIKQMLLSLQLSVIKESKYLDIVFSICLDNDLYTPLIVVCPRIDNDFITPLQKLYSRFLQTENEQMLLKCLWYIRLTFKQILFPNEKLSFESWQTGYKQMMMWLLIEEIFRKFAVSCPIELFEILIIATTDPCLPLLQSQDEQLDRYFQIQQGNYERTNYIVNVINMIYQNLQQSLVTHEQVRNEFSKYIGQLNLKEIHLSDDLLIKCLKNLIQNGNNYDLIINILNNCQLQPKDRDELFNSHNIANKQIQALFCSDIFNGIDLALKSDTLNVDQFFNWIYQYMRVRNLQITKIIDIYFPQFLKLSIKKFAALINKLNMKEQFSLLNREICDGYLELLRTLNPTNKQIRQLYIKALCILTPNDVLQFVADFPLDELQSIFLETKHKEGLGYVKKRIGKYQLAVELFVENLIDFLEESLKLCLKGQFVDEGKLNQKFDYLLDASIDSYKYDDNDLYLQIGVLLFNDETYEKVWKFTYYISEDNYKGMINFLQILNKKLSDYYNLVSRTNLAGLIQLMQNQNNIFGMLWMKWSFKQLFNNEKIEFNLTKKVQDIQIEQYLAYQYEIYYLNASSPNHYNICNQCKQVIFEDNVHVMIRRCGHSTHQNCLQLPYCQLCNTKIKMQLENVLANYKKTQLSDLKMREQARKDNLQMKSLRQLEDDINDYETTDEDLKLHAEQKVIRELELFDQYIESIL